MAKVEVTKAKVETKVVEIEPARVNVEMTMDEATALRALLGKTARSGPLYSLYRSLMRVGVSGAQYRVEITDARDMRKVVYPRIEVRARRGLSGDEEW